MVVGASGQYNGLLFSFPLLDHVFRYAVGICHPLSISHFDSLSAKMAPINRIFSLGVHAVSAPSYVVQIWSVKSENFWHGKSCSYIDKTKTPISRGFNGAAGRSRTCDLQLRKLTLYPAELRLHDEMKNRLAAVLVALLSLELEHSSQSVGQRLFVVL